MKKKKGEFLLPSLLSITTLPLLLTEFIRAQRSKLEVIFLVDYLLAATVTVENFDANQILDSFYPQCFKSHSDMPRYGLLTYHCPPLC